MSVKDIRFRVWHLKENKMYFRGYQKFLHVLLCADDHGENSGRGNPVRRASYKDCVFLESTSLFDKNRQEIFEGDIVRVSWRGRVFQDVVGPVPDTFGLKALHPLDSLFKKNELPGHPEGVEIEIFGNEYEGSE